MISIILSTLSVATSAHAAEFQSRPFVVSKCTYSGSSLQITTMTAGKYFQGEIELVEGANRTFTGSDSLSPMYGTLTIKAQIIGARVLIGTTIKQSDLIKYRSLKEGTIPTPNRSKRLFADYSHPYNPNGEEYVSELKFSCLVEPKPLKKSFLSEWWDCVSGAAKC